MARYPESEMALLLGVTRDTYAKLVTPTLSMRAVPRLPGIGRMASDRHRGEATTISGLNVAPRS
jgi:hypothetical protein